jgi:hypothetical protein
METRVKRPKKRGYSHHSPAVCVIVYDITGRALPDRDVQALVDSIQHIVSIKGYVFDVVRT